MPDGTLEEDLIAVLVSQGGAQVEMVRFLDDQHHLALVVCSSPENALDTLVSCHGQLVASGDAIPRPMRIGFSQGSDLGAHAAVEDYLGTVEYGLPDAGEAL
jgi:polypyrimidine tract-binding protein 1/polypyrimidine tract-binding protein 2